MALPWRSWIGVHAVIGLVWYLSSRFFVELTLESLVYTAPFPAPLAYTALGLLLVMNRMVASRDAFFATRAPTKRSQA